MTHVYILLEGSGEDGDEEQINSVYSTYEKAKQGYKNLTGTNYDNTSYRNLRIKIEEWEVE